MNWDAVGAIGEIVGGIVVVISLVYLGAQLRQSNRHAAASALTAFLGEWNHLLNQLVSEESVQATIREGFQDFQRLTKSQKAVFHMRIGALVNHWLLAGELREKNLVSNDLYEECTDFIVSVLSSPGGLQYWEFDSETTPKGKELLTIIKSGERGVAPIGELLPWWSSDDAE